MRPPCVGIGTRMSRRSEAIAGPVGTRPCGFVGVRHEKRRRLIRCTSPHTNRRGGALGLAAMGAGGMSERHIDAEGERRLDEAGFVPVESHIGKRRWRVPETGRVIPGGAALDKVERREEQELEEAGWERVEIEGETYWCKPDSGHLYPRGAAYDVHKREGAAE